MDGSTGIEVIIKDLEKHLKNEQFFALGQKQNYTNPTNLNALRQG